MYMLREKQRSEVKKKTLCLKVLEAKKVDPMLSEK